MEQAGAVLKEVKISFNRDNRQWLLAVLLPLLVYAFTVLVFGVRFEVNDDATMSNIAAGAYGPDSQYLIYINVLVGYLLKPFYAMVPSFSWYTLFQVLLCLLCFMVLCRLAMQKAGTLYGALLSMGVLLTFGVDNFMAFQYVKNSGLLLVTGLALIAEYLGTKRLALYGGIALVVLGSMLRFTNFFGVGALSAALLLWRFFQLDRQGKKRAVATMAVLFVLVFGLKTVDTMIYVQNEDWNTYLEYNEVRTKISDYSLQFLENPALVAQFGYDINDYWTIEQWNYYDPQVFPVETLRQFSELLPRNSYRAAAWQTVQTGLRFLYQEPMFLCLGLSVLGWLIFANKKNWYAAVGTGGMLALLLFYLCFRGRIVHRVEWGLALGAVVFLLLSWQKGKRLCKTGVLAAGLCVLCLFSAVYNGRDYAGRYQSMPTPDYTAVSEDKEHLYVMDVLLINSTAGFDVWQPRPKNFFSNIVAVGGWISGTPFEKETMERYGYEYNPYQALAAADGRVFLIDGYNAEIKETYLQEHYHTEGSLVRVADFSLHPFGLYQLQENSAEQTEQTIQAKK